MFKAPTKVPSILETNSKFHGKSFEFRLHVLLRPLYYNYSLRIKAETPPSKGS
jgi:hypothetical protein